MYEMVRQMWQLGRITAEEISILVARGRLRQEQAEEITSTVQGKG